MIKHTIYLEVIPKSSITKIIYDELTINNQFRLIKLKITAIPENGQANKFIIKFLAKYLNIPQSKIFIVSGINNRKKKIEYEI